MNFSYPPCYASRDNVCFVAWFTSNVIRQQYRDRMTRIDRADEKSERNLQKARGERVSRVT